MCLKKSIPVISILATTALFSGCASNNDVLINGAHYQSLDIHNKQQTKQVSNKSTAIKDLFTFECSEADKGSEACGALQFAGRVIASDRIASIKPQKFTEPKPVTSLDVQQEGLKTIAGGLPIAGMTVTTVKAIDKNDGDTTITADNGSTVSTNQEEIHSQTTGENSAPTVTVDKSDNTAEPAIVEVPIDTAGVE